MVSKIKGAKALAKKAAFKDYFKVLDVTIKSDEKEIKKQYRTLALKWHPDRNSQSDEQREKAANMMVK
jgi:DnaJ-class molecular chaperone